MLIDQRQVYPEPVVAVGFNVWVDIKAPPATVFHFLTHPSGLQRWWAARCEVDPRPGGHMKFVWSGAKETTGEAFFRRFEPPNLVVWEWTSRNGQPLKCDGADPRGMRWPARNTFQLAYLENQRTRLHLNDLGIHGGDDYESVREATIKGWREAVSRLQKTVEFHHRQKLEAKRSAKAALGP